MNASNSAGNTALAATAKARPTTNDTFSPSPARMETPIANRPMPMAAMRPTHTSCFSLSSPSLMMFE